MHHESIGFGRIGAARAFVQALALGTGLGCAGCRSADFPAYGGSPKPPSEIAKVEWQVHQMGFPGDYTTIVVAMDGTTIPNSTFRKDIEILPGAHTANAIWVETICVTLGGCGVYRQSPPTQVSFNAVAGKTYRVLGDHGCSKFWFWVEDSGSSSVVGGEKIPPNC